MIKIKHYKTKASIPKSIKEQLSKLVVFKGSAMHVFITKEYYCCPVTMSTSSNPRIYVALDDNIPIAWTCHYGGYLNVYVKKSHRKKGIATRLIKRVVAHKKNHYTVHKKIVSQILKKVGITSKIRYW